ncbi:hypothetical protein AcV5_005948 [Taiwanofungus camphoratus]|nr:hypothetical protein AcV5_005948 [Antrodia cinnamomea]
MPWAVATTAVHETNGGSDSHVVHQHEKRPADLYTQTFDRLSSREQGPDGGPTARVPFGRATTHAHAGPSGTGMHGLAPDDTAPLAAGSRGMRGGPSGERRLARGWGARRPGALRRQDPGRLLCPSAQPPVLAAAAEPLRPPGTSLVSPHALFTWWVRGDADFQCS